MAFTIHIPRYPIYGDGEDYMKHRWKKIKMGLVPVTLEMPIKPSKWSVKKVVG